MLSRRNSRGFSRLRDARSSSPLRLRSARTEADLRSLSKAAYQQAVTAASLAFERVISSSQRGRHKLQKRGSVNNVSGLERRKSVRFTGPKAEPIQKRSITRRQARTWHHVRSQDYSLQAGFCDDSGFEEQTLYSPQDVPSEVTRSIPPSPCKTLRKSKSMFSPLGSRPRAIFRSEPQAQTHSKPHQSQQSETVDGSPMISQQSKTLGSIGERSYKLPSPCLDTYDQELAIQQARDEYMRHLEIQSLEQKSSTASLRARCRAQKAFRKSVRTNSSNNSYGAAIASHALPAPDKTRMFNIGPKARKISNSFKDKIKRIFRKTSSSNNSLPSQHIDSQRPHFGSYEQDSSTSDDVEFSIPMPSAEALDRNSSRSSSIGKLRIPFGQDSLSGSTRSLRSSRSSGASRSRVTSWTNSVETTATKQLSLNDVKRLSIIQENTGPHQPSSSVGLVGSGRKKGYALFGQPLQPGSGRINEPVDSRVIFSAIQKRLDERNRSKEQSGPGDDGLRSSEHGSSNISKRSCRRTSGGTQRSAFTTIRMIGEDCSEESLPPTTTIENSKSLDSAPLPISHPDDVFRPSLVPSIGHKRSNARVSRELSLQEIADQIEGISYKEKKPILEQNSAFFPPQRSYTKKQPSPYRKVMQSRAQDSQTSDSISDREENAMCESVDSGSVYSRAVDGTPKLLRSLDSIMLRDENRLDVRIRDDSSRTVESVRIATNPILHENEANLTNNATKKEKRKPSPAESGTTSQKTTRHFREKAQIKNGNKDGDKGRLVEVSAGNASGSAASNDPTKENTILPPSTTPTEKESSRPPLAERQNPSNNVRSQEQTQGSDWRAGLLHGRTKSLMTLKARPSPERTQRLRRKQSIMNVTLSKENCDSPRSRQQIDTVAENSPDCLMEDKEPVSASKMVDRFLKSRRSMPTSEGTSSPVFI